MRKKRQDSKLGIYRIVMRGINKENIFEDNDDKNRFIQTLYRFCEKLEIGLISYKLMNNHVHFQVKTAAYRFELASTRAGSVKRRFLAAFSP